MQDINNLLQLLMGSQTEFVLIGGYACVVHGASQITRDLDICGPMNPPFIQKLRTTLKDVNPKHRLNPNSKVSFLVEPQNLDQVKNLYLETDLGIIDIVSEVTGVGNYARVVQSAVEIKLFEQKVKVICVEDLISSYKKLKRDKDKLALHELMAIQSLKK